MKHLNSNILCVCAFKATGKVPQYHEMIELTILALNGQRINKKILPFNMKIKPRKELTIKVGSKEDYYNALPDHQVMALFEKWYEKLNLKYNKRIIPVGINLHLLHGFLTCMMGWSDKGENFVDDFFDFTPGRSLTAICQYWNDLAAMNQLPYPFNKQDMTYAANRLGYVYDQRYSTLDQAQIMAEVYERVVSWQLGIGTVFPITYPKTIDYSVYEIQEEEEE